MLKLRCVSLFLMITFTVASDCMAGVPKLINYQGTITGPAGPLDGAYDLTFTAYADSTGGSPLWTEFHGDVPVTYGLFNVILGRYVPIPDALFEVDERWIAIQVEADPEIAPRMRITAVPWTMRAAIAESSLVSAPDGDWAFAGGDIYRSTGKVGVGRISPSANLDVFDNDGDAYLNISGENDGQTCLNFYEGAAYLCYDIAAPEVRLWNAVTSGNAGDIAFGTFNIERMRIKRDGEIGIGVSMPQYKLDVDGTVQMTGFRMPAGASNGHILVSNGDGDGTWQSPYTISDGDWNFVGSDIFTFSRVGIGRQPTSTDVLIVKASSGHGIYGENQGSGHYGFLAGDDYGVYGYNDTDGNFGYVGGDSCGVYGLTNTANRAGVYGAGEGANSYGVRGREGVDGNYGILGASGCGVLGRAYGSGDAGVRGYHGGDIGSLGNELRGVSGYSSAGYGVRGESSTGHAGWFQGDVYVNGTLSKAHGTFLIDHPLDPENRLLRHMFVESPENLCIYRGKAELDARGEAVVEMPGYFAALTKEDGATVSLTSVGRPFLTGYEWRPGFERFTIYGEPDRAVSWVVYADRDDPVARMLTRPVEEDKGPGNKACNRGELLNPGAYGYPESSGKDYRFSERRVR